jgi:hypothetical protein
MSILFGIFVVMVPTIIVTMWALYVPIYIGMKKHHPTNIIVRHPIVYFITALLSTAVYFPVFFYFVILGDCSKLRVSLFRDLVKEPRFNK